MNLRLEIPPEASNSFCNLEHKLGKDTTTRILTARERRISMFTRILEPSLTEPFYFLYFTAKDGTITREDAASDFRKFLLHVNKMKPLPKFIAMCGGLTDSKQEEDQRIPRAKLRLEDALDCLESQVKVLYVAASGDFKGRLDKEDVDIYKRSFGDDWYGFWVCGVAFLVLNTVYHRDDLDNGSILQREEQNDWIDSELLQQQIFQAKRTIILQDCAPCRARIDNEENEQTDYERWLNKFERSGVTHLLCRERYDRREVDAANRHIHILPNEVNEKSNWFVRLVKVTSDDVIHTLYAPNELPELVYI